MAQSAYMDRFKGLLIGSLLAILPLPLVAESSLPPADLSLFVFDLKYNHQQGVKICEVQPCAVSAFHSGFQRGALIAKRFVALMDHYWDSSNCAVLRGTGDAVLQNTLLNHGWKARLPQKKSAVNWLNERPTSLKQYRGAVYCRTVGERALSKEVRDNHRDLFFLEEYSAPFIRNKKMVYNLIKGDPQLEALRPQALLLPASYHGQLADEILSQITSDKLVIKPTASGMARGVIIVNRAELDRTLQELFDSSFPDENRTAEEGYGFWRDRPQNNFLIEEFVLSEPVTIRDQPGKTYDPTIRVVAAVTREEGIVQVHFLGHYWKFPNKSIEEGESLQQTHKSLVGRPFRGDIPITIWKTVKDSLAQWLPLFYNRIKQSSNIDSPRMWGELHNDFFPIAMDFDTSEESCTH